MSTLGDRTQAILDARMDVEVLPVAETPQDERPVEDSNPAIPDATLNTIINKMRHGRGDMWIKHNVTTPAGKAPTLDQIREIRALWAAEVVESTPEP